MVPYDKDPTQHVGACTTGFFYFSIQQDTENYLFHTLIFTFNFN